MQLNESNRAGNASKHDQKGLLCLYPSKRCDNSRVTKANGQLHKFCQYHRDKANYNQRQLEFKRKQQQQQHQDQAQTAPIPSSGPRLLPKPPSCAAEGNESEFELDEEHIRLIEEVASSSVSKDGNQ
ncbi:unnamed protein product [Phytophthora lilii]|uniref:Unnamed protein product n=1 Tax=Phytophthora lilii TaxID=2077276 RepID=A0A9W6WUU5_9STRA|nr:unnamed protein product [Phytophthora lilii]